MSKHSLITLRRQRGLSLVELMIGLTLGLILLLGIIQVFMSSKQTFATNDAMAKLQENGRFALEFITQSARQAGYTSPGSKLSRPSPVERMVCGTGNSASNPCAFNGSGSASDVVGFTFEPPIIDGAKRDCAGREVPDDVLIVNSFFIWGADADNPISSLACRSFIRGEITAYSSARLVDGIDSFQILYGLDTGGDSKSVNQYVSADRVDWDKVKQGKLNILAVRIAVLANSVDVLNPAPVQRNYYLLDAAPFSSNDGRARQVFTTTVQFKNL